LGQRSHASLGTAQMFRALAFYLRETSATEVRWQRSEISRKAAGPRDISGEKIMILNEEDGP